MRNDQLADRIARLTADIREMKLTQPLAGDAWRVYRGRSAGWDIDITGQPVTYTQLFKVTYTPVGANSPNPFATFAYETQYSNTSPGYSGYFYDMFPDHADPCSMYVYIYAAEFGGWSPTVRLQMKFTAFSPYRGSISIQTA